MASRAHGILLALLLLLTPAAAISQVPGRPTSRPASPPAVKVPDNPRNVDDLRNLQARVQAVREKVLPATIGVYSRLGQGSGVIVSKDGLVLTAGHVAVEGGFEVSLVLADGKRVRGRVLGINRSADAAMVKISDKGEYPFVDVAQSGSIRLGQWSIALGHPGGYRSDRPPVLRLGRIIEVTRTAVVSTNTLVGGDSGGPLFDLDGKLIGIHSRIGEATIANIHVPIDVFLQDWDRMLKGEVWGAPPRPRGGGALGVFTADHPKGLLVQGVLPNSPAAKAGIRASDIITALDGKPIRNARELSQAIGGLKPDAEVKVDLLRDDKKQTVTVKLSR